MCVCTRACVWERVMWYIELDDERVWVCKRPDYLFLDSKWIFEARSPIERQRTGPDCPCVYTTIFRTFYPFYHVVILFFTSMTRKMTKREGWSKCFFFLFFSLSLSLSLSPSPSPRTTRDESEKEWPFQFSNVNVRASREMIGIQRRLFLSFFEKRKKKRKERKGKEKESKRARGMLWKRKKINSRFLLRAHILSRCLSFHFDILSHARIYNQHSAYPRPIIVWPSWRV